MKNDAFSQFLPDQWTSSTVFSSPHSGRNYTDAFLKASVLDRHAIRSSEDVFVDELFAHAPGCGAPLICASAPRAFLDLNRSDTELDPAVIINAPKVAGNPRIAAGLGVIPRVVAHGRAIQRGKISMDDAKLRLDRYYHPYHNQLEKLLNQVFATFQETLLVDCHSMPHSALDNIAVRGGLKPDIVIGDRFGSSCVPEIADRVERAFLRQDFIVARNLPFAGAYIMRKYGRPVEHRNAVQIEIDRSIYMNEDTLEKSTGYNDFKARLDLVIAELSVTSRASLRYAAE